ncbi:MAG: right-handed parallel beta-helix repeat-containing protein [Bacteroidetes bacterium]|nr:right-handed parallel beta-helix repeat-containing protein [Bacteroidota bacterium]
MRKLILFLIAVCFSVYLPAQSFVAFHENFELPSSGDSVASTTNPAGGNQWAITTNLSNSGLRADSVKVQTGTLVYLTTNSFSTAGYSKAYLYFAQICKVYNTDGGYVEVSTDNGLTWTTLSQNEYRSNGNLINSKFSESSYPDWLPGDTATKPTSLWWKNEIFDISNLAANKANVIIRFTLFGSGNPLGNGRYGWLMDDIKVMTANNELIPPKLSFVNPILKDTVYFTGPFTIKAYIKDSSAISLANIVYNVNGGSDLIIPMTNISDSTYSADIPSYAYNNSINYKIVAADIYGNTSIIPSSGNQTFKILKGNATIQVGNTTTANYNSPVYIPSSSTTYLYSYNVSIYNKNEIMSGGVIQSIAYNKSDAGGYNLNNASMRIYLKGISTTTTPSTYADYVTAKTGAVKVYENTMQNLNTASGWQTFVCNTGNYFTYTGADNLMVFVEFFHPGNATNAVNFYYTTSGTSNTFYGAASIPSSSITTGQRANMKINFLSSTQTYDATALSFPTLMPTVTANTAIPVTVTIKNLGTATMTKAKVNWSVDGATQTPYNWTGSLPQDFTSTSISLGNINLPFGPHIIKAWTSLPNDSIDQTPANDTLTYNIFGCSVLNGIYTVGTPTSNFPTFNDVFNAINNCGISGPVDFKIASGTYTTQLTIPLVNNVTASNTLTFESATGNKSDVIIKYSSTGLGDNWVVRFDGSKYIIIKNITFKALGDTYGNVAQYANGASYNTLEGCSLEMPSTTSSNYYGVSNPSSTLEQYNITRNNTILNGYYGIYFYGSSSTALEKGNVTEGNIISGYYSYGLYSYYQDSVIISGNTLENGMNSLTSYAMMLGYNNNLQKITKNKIYVHTSGTNANYGLYLSSCTNTAAQPGIIANNFISQSGTTGTVYGIYCTSNNYQGFYHNSVNVTSGSLTTAYSLYVSSGTNLDIYNNIFSNTGGGYAYYIGTTAAINNSDYNDLYTTGINLAYWGSAKATLGDLQTASGKDINSKNMNPIFVSVSNLHVTNFALYGTGTPLTQVTDDIDGQARPNPPCIGADEFIIPQYDAAITMIKNPLSSITTLNQNIRIVLKNYGTQNLTSDTIKWLVNGVMQPAYAWTGNLATNAVDTVTIGNFTFNLGSNTLKIFSTKPNNATDIYNYNDSVFMQVYACTGPFSGTYTIGGSGATYPSFSEAVKALKNCGVSGPTVFNVNAGTYNEQFVVPFVSGVSAINTITFKAANNDSSSVVIDASSSGSLGNFVARLDSAQFIRFEKLTFKNIITTGRVIEIYNAAKINTITNCALYSMPGAQSSTAVVFYSYNSKKDYTIITNNYISGGYYSVYLYGVSTTIKEVGNVIQNNVIKDFYYYGIYSYYQDSIRIIGNYLQNHATSTSNYGVYAIYNDNGQFLKNKIVFNGTSSAFCMYFSSNNSGAGNSLVANNFISQSVGNSTVYGLYSSSSNNMNFYNNSVNITGQGSSGYAFYISAGTNVNIVNNNLSHTGGSGYAYYASSVTGVGVSNYNNLYCTGTFFAYWTTAKANLAALQAASGKDLNSISITPIYNSVTDLHTDNINLWAKGTALTQVTDDIDGQIRAATPCIGADEFVVMPNDARVKAIYTLGKIPLIGSSPHQVKAIIKNMGSNKLYSLPVTLNITGSNTYTTVLTRDSIAVGAEDTLTFAGFTPTTLGVNNVKVSVPNDDVISNNQQNYRQLVTDSVLGFPDTSAVSTSVGFAANQGLLLSKHHIYGSRVVKSVRAFITGGNTIGQSVYGIILNAAGAVLDTSAYRTITAADTNTWVIFNFTNASAGTISNNDFYLGIAQRTGTSAYYPLGAQTETYNRGATFYSSSSLTGGALTEAGQLGRFMLEANLGFPANKDAGVSQVISPSSGCGLSNETVKIRILNIGTDTIFGGQNVLTAHYALKNNGVLYNTVNQMVIDTILPSLYKDISFVTPVNLAVSNSDSNFKVVAWVDLVSDPFKSNDTLVKTVASKYVPAVPAFTNPSNIAFATSAILNLTTNDSVYWYANLTDTVSFTHGKTYTTPVLYDTTTYWIQAVNPSTILTGGSGNVGLLATSAHSSGGVTGIGPELYNDGIILPYNTSGGWGWTTQNGWIEYTWTAAQTINKVVFYKDNRPMSTCTFQYWNGTAYVDFYSYNNAAIQDSVIFNPVTTTKLRFNTIFASAGNPNFREIQVFALPASSVSNCATAKVAVKVNVAPGKDAGLAQIITPNSACGLINQTVQVKIKNKGNQAIIGSQNQLTAYYGIKYAGNIINVVSQTVPNNIAKSDSVNFTFNTLITLPAPTADSNYTLVAWTNLINDVNNSNDTTLKSVISKYTPTSPSPINITVSYGTAATINVITNDTVLWYYNVMDTVSFARGKILNTPILFDTITYYANTSTNQSFIALIGNGTVQNSNAAYPSPYGQYYNGCKEQYLITKAELNALGIQGGPITSLGFDVVSYAGPALTNYTIKIGHTNQMALSSWMSGLTQVYSAASLAPPVAGWNIYSFSTPFIWNGVDNIVIENCFDNYPNGFTYNAVVNQTTTSFVSCLDSHYDGGGICANPPTTTLYSQRPNMKLLSTITGCTSAKVPMTATVSGVPALDIAVAAITQPMGAVNTGTSYPVKAKITTWGTTPITSATINWSVNGVLKTPVTYTSPTLTSGQTSGEILLGNTTFVSAYNTIKVWTSNPNGGTDGYPLNDTIKKTVLGCMSGTFTIGAGKTFPSFNSALSVLDSAGVCGNVVFVVDTGTYNERLFITPKQGMGPNATVTFTSSVADSNKVVLKYNTSPTAAWLMKFSNASYFKFNKMKLSVAGGNTWGRIMELADSANHIEISNCILEGLSTGASSTNFDLIYASGAKVNFNTFKNNLMLNGSHAIYLYGLSTDIQNNNKIIGNTIKNTDYMGMYLYYQDTITVTANSIENSTASSTFYGIYSYYSSNINIQKNKLNSTAAYNYGFYINYSNSAVQGSGIIANNFISQSVGTSTSYGIYSGTNNNLYIANNSVNITGAYTSNYAFYISSGANNYILNNIFVNTGGGYAYYNSSGGITQSNNNDIYTNTANFGYWGGACTTLAAFKTASGKDQNSISLMPNFNSLSDLHVMMFDLNGAGIPVAGVTDDIDGDIRNTTTPDIGADEFNLPPNDAGITAVTTPVNPTTAGSQAVKVILRNFGNNNLTTASIRWSVDGVMQTAYPWTGNLATGAVDTVNIGSYNFLAGHSNMVKVWPTLPNGAVDGLATNDTTIKVIIACSGGLAGTYTIGGTGANFMTFNSAVQALTYCGVNGAVTFNVNPGVYTEQFAIGAITGASAVNRITFQSANGDSTSVKLGFDFALTGNNYVVQLAGAQYITIRKISVIQTNVSNGRVITFTGSPSNIIIANNRIEMPANSAGTTAGIVSLSSDFGNDNMLLNNYILSGYNGIVANGVSGTSKRNIIEGNIINGFHNYGIQADYQDSCVIRKNVITCNNVASGKRAITITAAANNLFIEKNKINMSLTGSAMYGIYISTSTGTLVKPQLIANNFITINGSTGYGVFLSAGNYVTIANNSLNTDLGIAGTTSVALNLNGGTNNRLYNNNVVVLDSAYTVYVSSPSVISNSNNNNFFKSSASNFAYWGSTVTSLTALKALSNQDTNSVSLDPDYISATDLHVYTIAMNNIGKPIPEVSDDIDGQLRSTTTPDIGADEFAPLQYDIALTAILAPVTLFDQAGASIPFKVRIKNYGADSVSNFNVVCRFGSGTPVNYLYSGVLHANSADVVTFPNQTVLSGPFEIKTYTSLPNDLNHNNDTIKKNYYGVAFKSVPYTENFDNANTDWFSLESNTLWQKGAPASSMINTAHTAPNVWKTNLTGNYLNNISDTLYTPIFDNSVFKADTMKFWHWVNAELNKDGGYIEYTSDGTGWSRLGQIIPVDTNATNWYNGASTSWWTGSFTGWQQSKYKVKNLNTIGNILQFRFIFASDATNSAYNGWAIDDFELTLAPIPADGGLIAITSPSSASLVGDLVPVTVIIKNFGTAALTNIPVKYQVGSGAIVAGSYSGTIAPGATATYTFTQSYQVANTNYSICAYTEVVGDIYTSNDKSCKNVIVNPAQKDVGITQLLQPIGSVSQNSSVTVKVRIKNYGTLTQTSIPVYYQRGNQTPISETWTGSLAAGDSTDYSFTQQMAIPIGTSVSFLSWTKLPNDAYPFNDTISKSITICNVAAAGTISGPISVTPGSTQTYTVPTISNATSYNWVLTPASAGTITGTGNTISILFSSTPGTASLTVNGVSATCSGSASVLNNISIGVGVDENDANNFWLAQNMPNPTSGITNIEYMLPTAGDIKFVVINLFGQKVYETENYATIGKHLINLNVNDLAAGVYYYIIEFKGKRLVKKMVVNN